MRSLEVAASVRHVLRTRMSLAVAGGIVACAAAMPAHGEAVPEDTAADATRAVVEEIVVTARRREERLQDVPVAVQAFGAEQVRQYDITNISNIKVLAPQVSFDRAFTGSGTSISMRGISSASLDAGLEQSVLLDIDGMPISRGRILADAIFDVASIEVMKGPQALFFGKNTPGGVVSLRAALPTADHEGYARVGHEFESRAQSVEAALSGPVSDSVGYRLAVYASQSEGHIRNLNPGIDDPFRIGLLPTDTGGTFVPAAQRRLGAEDKYGFRGTLTYDNGEGFDLVFRLLATYSRNQSLQSLTEVMSCAPGQTRPRTNGVEDPYGDCKLDNRVSSAHLAPRIVASWPEIRGWETGAPSGSNESYLPTLTLNYGFGDLTLTSTTGYYRYDYRSGGHADATAYGYYFSYQKEKFDGFVEEVRLASSFDGPLNFVAGGYYETTDRTQTLGATLGATPADPATGKFNAHDNLWDNTSDAYSVFGQLIYKPVEQLEIAGGARYTKQERTLYALNTFVNPALAALLRPQGVPMEGDYSEDNTSPEATVTWKFSPDMMVYGAYKTGYLSGGFSNLGTFTAAITLPAVTYKPTEVDGFEVGTKFSLLDGTLSGSLVGYRYQYEGLQLTTFNAAVNPPSFTTTNAADTRSEGVELELAYTPPVDGLTLRGGVYYNDAKYRDFANAQCYAGQTAEQGCVEIPGSTARGQDLSGQTVWRAPEWIYTAGVVYDRPLGEHLKLGLNADLRHVSEYYVSTSRNPGSIQDAYTAINAGVRLGAMDDRWTISLIGRNLTNEIFATLGTDKPGGSGEVMAVAGEPRAVVLQLETRF
jgi:iron complex outermembrane receptor protein